MFSAPYCLRIRLPSSGSISKFSFSIPVGRIPVFSGRILQVSVRYFCIPSVGANTKLQCRIKERRYNGINRFILTIPFV